ncbi:ATP-binding protein [Streptomyces sp. MJP52]|uniref:sensor histidine kinase n=1 Tax=Streptomyces sp. MJP52 TaxID=2940555 RepID=UPI0024755F69|nr:ATP-binding protein [Streptomyces sp. MJP52]MDH6228506.1 signal transduction histidine kinase [Streptomyces sp. MJP52]
MTTRPQRHRSTSAAPPPDPPAGDRDRAARRSATTLGALPAASATLLAGAAYAAALSPLPTSAAVGAGICAAIGCAAVTTAATVSSRRAAARTAVREEAVAREIRRLPALLEEGLRQITAAARRVRRGETAEPLELPSAPPAGSAPGPATDLTEAVLRTLAEAHAAVLTAGSGRRTDASLTMVRKIQSLVLDALELLDDAHDRTEDPELLDVLFRIDHLVTRTLRAVESVAVLDGRLPRAVRRPVPLTTVLRQAAAETEEYTRIQVAPPPAGYAVAGPAAAEVIHLIAELAENGARFSPAGTKVTVRAALAREGLVVEIDDQGPGLTGDQLEEMNQLVFLTREPDGDDGRTGLAVVARVAQRLRLAVRFQTNLYGGVQALVRLPSTLLHLTEEDRPAQEQPDHQRASSAAAHPTDTLPLAQVRVGHREFTPAPATGLPQTALDRARRGGRAVHTGRAVGAAPAPEPAARTGDGLFGPYPRAAWHADDDRADGR